MALADAEPCSPRDLQLPAIRWHAERSPYEVDAATFDEDTNILTIDPYWRGLLTTLAQWIEQPFSVLGWIERVIRFRHAMKLIERVLLHENFVASRVQATEAHPGRADVRRTLDGARAPGAPATRSPTPRTRPVIEAWCASTTASPSQASTRAASRAHRPHR